MSASTSSPGQSEVTLSGRSISPGLGMGQAWVVGDVLKCSGTPGVIGENDVDDELLRLTRAFEETLAELDRYAKRIEAEFDSALGGVFRAHGQMLRDLFYVGRIRTRAASFARDGGGGRSPRVVAMVSRSSRQSRTKHCGSGPTTCSIWAAILFGDFAATEGGPQAIPKDSVLIVERLLPSDVVALPKANVAAVVVETLGQGSHAALLAREKGFRRSRRLRAFSRGFAAAWNCWLMAFAARW